ncbi:hypothetical protein [Actinoplanes siamensis]|uniref:Uncharacterized protein n=1 Tax=Actinoplanes siamensis TaxID=1223317 RepID=A0A919N9E6_9ACTN|nr:hypothetical protein [Actinoplanes siamensis]GIF06943.1 hypothetical protein Asi03nite_44810 [Actinoplanes siamensis]
MQDYRSAAYLSSKKVSGRRPLLRTAQLNIVGWIAVTGLCAVGATAGLAVSRLAGVGTRIAMPAGGIAALVAVLAVDRRKWGDMPTSYSWTDDPDATAQAAALLTREGIGASAQLDQFGLPAVHYRNRDSRRVRQLFRSAGLPAPPTA